MTDIEYKDRKVGLILFGAFQLIIGAMCALLVPMMILSLVIGSVSGNEAYGQMNMASVVAGTLVYVVLAVWFIWLGIGSIMTKRWARTLLLVTSWIGFICGIAGMIVWGAIAPGMYVGMEELGQLPAGAVKIIQYITMAFMAVIYIVGPGLHILFYRSKHVKATCEARDPKIPWTDKCPPSILALVLMLVLWSASILSLFGYNFAVPFFGTILSGASGAVCIVIISLLCAYLARGVYKLKMSAWWGTMLFFVAYTVSFIATMKNTSLIEYYEAMNFPAEQLELFKTIDLENNIVMGLSMLLWCVVSLGYIFWIKKHFKTDEGEGV